LEVVASRKTSPPARPLEGSDAESAIPKLFPEESEVTGSIIARHFGGQRTIPAPPGSSRAPFASEPLTERRPDVGSKSDEIARLADTDEIPNLAGEDGTSTDQTALMADLSVRTGSRATLSVLTGLSAGHIIALEQSSLTLGRGKEATVLIRDPGVSRVHASITRSPHGTFEIKDLGSTNGVRVNGVRVTSYVLRVGDRVQLGPDMVMQFAFLDDTEEALTKHLYEAATRDPLTQALNRRAFDERLTAEFAHARRHRTLLSLVLCDIDHFKQVNDQYGHPTGDRVLRALAKVVHKTIRAEDVFARYGGEEFVVLVRGDTLQQTKMLADRLRIAVTNLEVRDEAGHLFRVTMSAGLAAFSELDAAAAPASLVALADQRLYRAKHSGRDRVCGD
jgi:two-component system cell cycle response regulator